MHYQPIVDLTTSEVVGFEALMRWQHPKWGQVPPDVFIPLAEQSDLIFELGSFALHEAARQAMSWERTGAQASQPYVTVNLSARQFHDPELLSMIEEALTTSGLAPERLVLEITESVALVDVVETERVIERLDHLRGDRRARRLRHRVLLALVPRALAPDDHQDRPVLCQPIGSEHPQRHAARGDRLARPQAQHDRARRGDRDPRHS